MRVRMTDDMHRVLGTISERNGASGGNLFRTRQGVVLRIKPVPPMLLQDARRHIPVPTPPKVHIEDKDTWEENLADPEYLRAMQNYESLVNESANALMLTRGTEVVEVPPGVDGIADESWSDDVTEFTGLEIPRDGRRRYYCWLKYVAIATQQDFIGVITMVSRVSGLTGEADVADAIERFPDHEARDTIAGPPLAAHAG